MKNILKRPLFVGLICGVFTWAFFWAGCRNDMYFEIHSGPPGNTTHAYNEYFTEEAIALITLLPALFVGCISSGITAFIKRRKNALEQNP